MRALLALAFLLSACGGRAPAKPAQNGTPTAGKETPRPAPAPLGVAPLDAELSGLAGAQASYVEEPVFGGHLYLLQVEPTAGGVAATAAPPLVLVHGLGDAGIRDFYPLLPELAAHRRVVAFDLPGFSRSTSAGPPYEPVRYAELVAHVIRVYAGGRADVLGHSMGGAIALEHSARHPEQVRRLVLVDAAGILHQDAFVAQQLDASIARPVRKATHIEYPGLPPQARKATEGVANTVVGAGRALLSVTRRLRPSPEVMAELAPQDAPTQAALGLIQHDFAPALSESRAPTLVLWGREDTVAPLRVARLLESRLPDSRLVVLDGVAHVPPTEAPRRTLDAVLAHLERTEPPTATGTEPPAGTTEPPAGTSAEAPTGTTEPPAGTTEPPTGAGASTSDAPQGATPPAPSVAIAPPPESVHCKDQADYRLSGVFDEIILDRCSRARLDGVTARRLIVRHSNVEGFSVHVHGGVIAEESVVTLTGGAIGGAVALDAMESAFDLAGVELIAERPVHVRGGSTFLLSACTLRTKGGVRYLHDMFALKPNQTF